MSENQQITILIVDDELSIRKLLEFFLKKYFSVVTASNGKEAKNWLDDANYPDIVIADLNMPIMNGLDLTRYIRSERKFNDVPVIILSGSESDEVKLECSEAGTSDFITKPFRPEYLHTIIIEKLKDSGKL